MVGRTQAVGTVSRAALAAIAVGAMVALTACGSQVPAGRPASVGGPSAGVALCRDIQQLTSVAASRMTTLHVLEPAEPFPPAHTIREPPRVRALAAALCKLPKMPHGPVNCPAQFRDSLRLAFAAGRRPFPPVTVEVSGCRVVTGLGPARTARSAAFWRTLGKDLGLPSAQSTSQSGGINP